MCVVERTLSTVRDECETHRGERVQLEKVAAMVPVLEEAGEQARTQMTELERALSAEREARRHAVGQSQTVGRGAPHGSRNGTCAGCRTGAVAGTGATRGRSQTAGRSIDPSV